MELLDGKAGIVTGSGRGIGGATVSLMAAEGTQVIVADLGSAPDGSDTDGSDTDGSDPGTALAESKAAALVAAGGQAIGVAANVTDSAASEALVQTCLDPYGKIDFVATVAGILRDRAVHNMTDAEFGAVIDVHLKGAFNMARAAAQAMRAPRFGSIITVTSISQRGIFGQDNDSAAKGGIASLTNEMAMELGRYGINVNSVLPATFTRMVESVLRAVAPDPGKLDPGAGMGAAGHVAPLFAYLASDEAKWITGQVIALGGERLALWRQPKEKVVIVNRGGFSLDDLRQTIPGSFKGQLEPCGIGATDYAEVDYEQALASKK